MGSSEFLQCIKLNFIRHSLLTIFLPVLVVAGLRKEVSGSRSSVSDSGCFPTIISKDVLSVTLLVMTSFSWSHLAAY